MSDNTEDIKISAICYMLRYDKRTLSKRGRKIRNIDFLTALKRDKRFAKVQVTHFCNTLQDGILYHKKAEDYAKVFRDDFGIDCQARDLVGFITVKKSDIGA